MKSKRIMSALLAGVMLTSTVIASCSKQEKEPPKSKRTNVYSGDEITLPADITYIDRIDYKNGKLYATYNTTYTITRNELGEEVERRVGYFYDDGVASDVPVAAYEVAEEEDAADVEATDAGETETAAEAETEPETASQKTAETGVANEVPAEEGTSPLKRATALLPSRKRTFAHGLRSTAACSRITSATQRNT